MLLRSVSTAADDVSASMLPIVKPPVSPSWKAPMITVIVGTSRKTARKPKNGSTGEVPADGDPSTGTCLRRS